MKRIFSSKSAFFNPRIFAAFVLVTFAISLGVFSFAAPRPVKNSTRQRSNTSLNPPTVINSTFNGVSNAMRDLPKVSPLSPPAETEHDDLLRVKPTHPVPNGFVDRAVQAPLAAVATIPAPNGTFEGQSSVDSAGGSAAGCICTPPDPNGAIGPTQYVQMVNSVVSVYDRAGTLLSGPTQINALFQSLPDTSRCKIDNNGDPVVVYDQLADRWVLTQFAIGGGNGPTSSECVAVSVSGDATGQYYIYDFNLSDPTVNPNGALFEDYPHIGLWPDAYYMSTHEFTFLNATPAGAYRGAAAWAMERDKMLAGQPARIVYFRLGAGDPASAQTFFGGQQPSTLDGFTLPPAGSPNYFVEVDSTADSTTRPDGVPPGPIMDIWKFHVDWSNPANSTFGDSLNNPNTRTAVTDFARPGCTVNAQGNCVPESVPQAGDPGQLDAIGDRLMYRNAYRNFGDHESLVLNHTVVAQAVGGHAVQMGPRWYEVRNPGGTPTIFQQSTLGPLSMNDLLYRWMSSIAMDHAGDMAIGYSTSSVSSFPSLGYAGRLASDPINTMGQGEAQMFAGTGPQHNELFIPFSPTGFGRWGDYTDMTVDPVDDCTFWYTNMYYSSTDAPAGIWHTRIGNFKFSQCTPRPVGFLSGTVTDSGTGNPIAGASVTAGGYTAFTNSSGFYQFSPLGSGDYTATASATGYFSSAATPVTVTTNTTTTQNFALARNQAVPTPTPAPPIQLQTVNPPVLNDPGTTVTVNNYSLTWSAAEVTTGLDHYVVEESTDYVNPLFDNADGTSLPGQAGSLWTTGTAQTTTASGDYPWIMDPTFHNSVPNSYEAPGQDGGLVFGLNSELTLKNPITIPAGVGSGRLTFYSRYYNDPDDTGNIEISTDGGAHWTSLRALNDQLLNAPANTRMQNEEIDLTAYKGTPFKLRFRFDGGPTVNIVMQTLGWWVDDINVDGATWHQIGTVGANTTSFNVLNRASGHYYYRVRGVYSNNNTTNNSNVQDIVVNLPTQFLSAKSRKVHGDAGTFDVDLPLSGPVGIEPRSGGAGGSFEIVYNFQNPITNCGSVSGTGSVSAGADGKSCVADVSGLPNAQYSTVTLTGVTDGTGTFNASASVGILAGDTNGNGVVNSSDVAQTQSQSGQAVTLSNFREDVTVNGQINSSDVATVQSKSGTGLP